jgi:hypothetical protein
MSTHLVQNTKTIHALSFKKMYRVFFNFYQLIHLFCRLKYCQNYNKNLSSSSLYARYLQLYTWNKPCFRGIQCCSCSVFTVCATCNVISQILYFYISTYYYYYYCPFSLLHSRSAGSQKNTCLTDQALLIYFSVRIFLTIRYVLTAFCIRIYRPKAGRRLCNTSSFESVYFWSFSVWRCGGCDGWELPYILHMLRWWFFKYNDYYYYYFYSKFQFVKLNASLLAKYRVI